MIIGLGNPGEKYENTRHNAGFIAVDNLAASLGAAFRKPFLRNYLTAEGVYRDEKIILVKPLTFMNRSGSVLPGLLRKYKTDINDIILVCDNLDLYPGVLRFKLKGGDAGHNGIKSVIANLDNSDFKRIYIGIGRPHDSSKIIEHVIGIPDADDLKKINYAAAAASESILKLVENPAEKVMNEINRIKNKADNSSC